MSAATNASGGSDDVRPPPKRRRVARACTNCRRRKARCDGEQPCEPCAVSKLSCSYNDGGRMTSTEYIQSLEAKVTELEELLGRSASSTSVSRSSRAGSHIAGTEQADSPAASHSGDSPSSDDLMDTIVDVDEDRMSVTSPADDKLKRQNSTELDPGDFGGLRLLRRVHKLCKHVSGIRNDEGDGNLPTDDLSSSFAVAPPEADSPISWEAFALLPRRETVDQAIETVLHEACCNMQFLDRQTLRDTADEVFQTAEAEDFTYARKPLSLIYAVVALSRLLHPLETTPPAGRRADAKPKYKPRTKLNGYVNGHENGQLSPDRPSSSVLTNHPSLRFFRASRALLDPANCRDVQSLQTLLCMILYTNGASMLSTCYSYICMAVAAALQMGLFSDANEDDSPEAQTKRKIFSVLSICDTYVTLALGLPRTLRDFEPARSLPIAQAPTDVRHPMYGTYMHARLSHILASIVETNHPFTKPIQTKDGFYGIEYRKIDATEERLEAWFNDLQENPPDSDAAEDATILRSQLMLRLHYAQVQMVLYRPFLHHALREIRHGSRTSLKAYACGSACVKAAMQAVWLVERLEASSIFNASAWHMTFIITISAACLCLFATSNRGTPAVDGTEDGVRRIKELCARHANNHDSLRRCLQFLNVGFRHAPPDRDGAEVHANQAAQSIPIDGPPIGGHVDPSLWTTFVQNTTPFVDAFQQAEQVDPEHMHGQDMLQALNLPQLQPFLNGRL